MTRKTFEVFECDVCGKEGDRYVVHFPDGVKTLDRCRPHAKTILALKKEEGPFSHTDEPGTPRRGFRVLSEDELAQELYRE